MKNGDTTLNLKTIAATAAALFITCGLMSEPAQAQDPDVWKSDFADSTGVFDSGDVTNPDLLPATQINGGDTRLRIGGGGGSFELINPGDEDVGTFSQMTKTASSSEAAAIFEIRNYEPSQQFYTRFTFKLSGGDDGNIHFLQGGGDNFGTNAGWVGDSFMGIRWSFEDDGSIETNLLRSTVEWSGAFIDEDEIFEKGNVYTVEVYGNNEETELDYYRNGSNYQLGSKEWALWIDGVHEDDFAKQDSFDEIDAVESFMFYSTNSEGNVAQIEIDDIVYANHLPVYREITGGPGWRMLSSPTDGLDATTLSRQNQVQGSIGNVGFGGSPNLYRFDPVDSETTPDSSWAKPADENDVFSSGEGFIWYLFDNDNQLPSKPLPMGLVSKGEVPDSDVTVSLHETDVDDGDNEGQSKWNLVGNPFGRDLDLSAEGGLQVWAENGSLASATAQVWDHDTESFIVVSDNSDEIAAFQGFFIENEDADNLVIPADAQTDGATFYRETEDDTRLLSLKLTGTNNSSGSELTDHAANVYFHPEAETGWDLWSASKLTPLSASHVSLGFLGERNGSERVLAQSSLPSGLDEEVTIPITISGTPDVSGNFEIGIESLRNIPEEWEIVATNTSSGSTYDLRAENPVIELNGNQQARSWQKPVSKNTLTVSATETQDRSGEWALTITPQDVTSSEPGTEVPQELVLDQNYPNPFNPVTTISFALPEDSEVQLEVYDVMGRKVTTLVDEQRSAGEHDVSWDASNASSGTYMYRLQVDGQIKTNTMTLVK